jgi:ElaB/YqjD/DUF883 family membrane-anchored ribosome-binding protein
LKDISLQYTGSPDNEKAIAARSGILKPSKVKPGDKVTIPATLLPPSTDGKLSPAVEADANRTIAEATLAGAALGAVGGGAGCKKKRAECAGGGALVGGLAGLFAGVAMVMAKQAFVSDEDRLNQEIAYAEKYNQELKAYNTELEAEVEQLIDESNQLRQQVKRGQANASQLTAQRKKIAAVLDASRTRLSDSHKEYARQSATYAGFTKGKNAVDPNTAKLKAENAVLKTEAEKTSSLNQKLAAIADRMSV